jgi:pimeloyl-ACP methyl ester carboxylesterase
MKVRNSVVTSIFMVAICGMSVSCAGAPPVIESFPAAASHVVEIDGVDIHYFDFNRDAEGIPIIWLHGYAGVGFEAFYIHDHLSRRVIALELPGSGLSEKPEVDYSIAFFANTVKRLAKELHIDRYVLVGHSMGGAVAAQVATDGDAQIEQLVLIAPYVVAGQAGSFLEFVSDIRVLVDLGISVYNEGLLGLFLRQNVFYDSELIPPDLVNYYARSIFYTERGKAALADVTSDVIGHTIDPDRLGDISVPTLLLWGTEDKVLPFDDAAEVASRIPRGEFASIARAGHVPHIERPGAVAFHIERFLFP